MRLCAAAALIAAAGFSVQSAWAAELGTLTVSSRLNEPLEAKLTINEVTEASQPLVLRLASDATYARVGQAPLKADLGVKLALASRNPWVVRVTSTKPVTEENMPLIVEMSEAGKLSAKFYRVRLEPAKAVSKAAEKTPEATTAKAGRLPSAQTPVASTAKSALPSVEKKAAAVKTAVRTSPGKTEAKSAAKPAPLVTAAKNDAHGEADLSRPVTVKSGMTMWSIARMYQPRYEGARTEEVLVALVRANPKAFDGGRVSGVKNGARLVPPSEKAVKAVGVDTAWCLVHVTPKADARKKPSAAAMAKAHARMDKLGIAYEKTTVTKPAAKPAVKPALPQEKPVEKPVSEPAKVAEPALSSAPENPAVAAEAPAQAPASAVVPAPEPAPQTPAAPAAPEAKPDSAQMTVTTATNIREDELPKAASETNHGWLWGILVALLAAGGGFFFWQHKKSQKKFSETERSVNFRRPDPTTAEQMKGMDQLFANRIAADAAAQKGFGAKTVTTAASAQASAPVQTTAAFQKTATVAAPLEAIPPAEAVTPKPFTIRSTAEGTQFELERPVDTAAMDRKIEEACTKINAGRAMEALPLLQDVLQSGTAEQKAAAERLMVAVKRG